jgi:hypothetical protein
MNVRAVEEEIKVRHLPGHDEKNANARQDKRQNETEQRPACQVMRCFPMHGMFRVQLRSCGLDSLALPHFIIFRSAAVPAAAGGNRKTAVSCGIWFEFRVLRVRTPALRSN